MKIQAVIDALKQETDPENKVSPKSIDQLIIGNPDNEVHGIVVTFMATVDVIKSAIKEGSNFIITHEPTWFSGHDQTEWLEQNKAFQVKKQLILDNNITIWRFHDHMHFAKHDLIMKGFGQQLGWQQFLKPGDTDGKNVLEQAELCFDLADETTLEQVLLRLKQRLNLHAIRYIGDPKQKVRKIAGLVGGASLGLGDERNPIELMADKNVDLAICGDITEWTLSAYIRDCNMLGINKSMVIIGHERSEEFGMKYLVSLVEQLTNVKTTFIDANEPFSYFV
ncbi:Nif3-like dinuclear metal center hexameric protein [Lactiplantibacillus xiangfangensis]|uniref:GTP cyclohydrolase 1 type 2 homolog n=1 Tax=Lactiplantibacillus xiangfangensis TaxID=942150 RepID=A0A0R2MJI9_9LACO|nr:Nif3-like dinuclear metal center hexameric protein [Lactiplantibacillus xiangfangensis]KRO10970.1 hypothetical protein IV64_GL002666 [Lactiplantibacillus xiangfangensis]